MALIKVDNETLLDMLDERVSFWTDDFQIQNLFHQMYENALSNGLFDECEFDTKEIVDNDYVNWCSAISEGDEDFEKVQELAKEGEYDISCETCYSFIEATNEDYSLILVRS